MSAQNGDTVMQQETLEQEEELALGEEKLKVVGLFLDFTQMCCVQASFVTFIFTFSATKLSRGSRANLAIVTRCN
jgi:hypothetical protein